MPSAPYWRPALLVGVLLGCLTCACSRNDQTAATPTAASAPTPSPFPMGAHDLIDAFHVRIAPTIVARASDSEPTPPSVSVTANADPDSGGAPLTVSFEGEVTDAPPGVLYRWDFGDNTSPAHELNVQHTYRTPGEYTATLTVTGPDIEESDDVSIEVTEEGFDVDIEADPDIGTAPLAVHFAAVLDDDLVGPFYYQWDFGDGAHDVTSPTTHTYRDPGQYTATLTVTNSQGQLGRKDVDIQVDAREGDADTQ
ncbi:MAG TPA: PKD domain-containing protein [Candidatus Acidoferrales bacterium]|nr:PKD domain-containing protein [Candidatus Acidoferrales bacterium]